MNAAFDKAVVSHGQDYFEVERLLLAGGATAQAALRDNLDHADPIGQLIAGQLLARMEGCAPDVEPALAYLDGLPNRLARTPIPSPSPLGVAAYLGQHFRGRVADYLALRLVKATEDPHWRVMGVLFYVEQQALPSTTSALLRFAARTGNKEWQQQAIAAIQAIDDPGLQAKLSTERHMAELQNRDFPEPLSMLIEPAGRPDQQGDQ